MKRIDAMRALANLITPADLCVCSIAGLWDDWWNLRPGGVDNTLSLSILGSVSSTALGLAVALPERRVVAFDTDGSMLMNTGILCTLGNVRPSNLTIIVFDNGFYESIGGPHTHTARNTDLARMAAGAGCNNCLTVSEVNSFTREADRLLSDAEFGFLVAKLELGRYRWPYEKRFLNDGIEDKYRFMRYVERLTGIRTHRPLPDM